MGTLDSRLHVVFAIINTAEPEQAADDRCGLFDNILGPDLIIAPSIEAAKPSRRPDRARPIAREGLGKIGK